MLFAGSPAPSANSIIYNSKTTKPQPRFAAGVFACFSCEISQNQRTPSHTLPKKAGNRFGNRTLGQTRRWRASHQAHGRANNPAVGIEQPMLAHYRELLKDPYFQPSMTEMGEATFPAELRWGGAEDADGLAIPLHFEGNPEFCEMTVEQEIGLMVELHGKGFYKAPHVKTIDLMSAFFDAPLDTPADLTLKLFAPPADGVNVEDGHADWMTNYYATLQEAPKMRIRYEVPGVVG